MGNDPPLAPGLRVTVPETVATAVLLLFTRMLPPAGPTAEASTNSPKAVAPPITEGGLMVRLLTTILAKEFGVSDVALAKTCKKLHVPVPGRG
jgi:hypothetical protein